MMAESGLRNSIFICKWHCKTSPSAIFASRWTFEVLWSLSHRISRSFLRQLHLHSLVMVHQAIHLCLESKFYCSPAVVPNEHGYLLYYMSKSNNRSGHTTVVNLPCANLKAMGQLNYSPKASRMKQQHFSEPWRTSCWCLTADWHDDNSPVVFNLFNFWPIN